VQPAADPVAGSITDGVDAASSNNEAKETGELSHGEDFFCD
jgi:hypothetical protein